MDCSQWLLEDLRKEMRLTQQHVADAAGLTQIRISQLERGIDKPTQSERARIVKAIIKYAAGRSLEMLH